MKKKKKKCCGKVESKIFVSFCYILRGKWFVVYFFFIKELFVIYILLLNYKLENM